MDGSQLHIPVTYQKVDNERNSLLDVNKVLSSDLEIVLIEVPKGFDKKRLQHLKVPSLEEDLKGKKVLDDYSATIKTKDSISSQLLCLLKKEKQFVIKGFDRYIKLYESYEDQEPQEESVINTEIIKKKSLLKNKRKRKSSAATE